MKNLHLHIPAGLSDLTPTAYARQRDAMRRIEEVFEGCGYAFIASPVLEYLAVFEGTGSVPPPQMYVLPDRSGEMLTLRPDMTPPAARMAATHPYFNLNDPLRLCYMEKNFRNQAHYQGKPGEFTQAGVELMGISSPQADAEVAALAVKTLASAGLKDFRVDIGQTDFLRGVLNDTVLDEAQKSELTRHIIARDYVAVEESVKKAGEAVPAFAREVLKNLTHWMGGPEILQEAARYAANPLCHLAVAHLTEVYEILRDGGWEKHVLFDLSMTGYLDYYTGIIFRGYAAGTGYAVVDGGRYDNLLAQFGKPCPAVGFALRLDGLLDAMDAQSVPFSYEAPDTLLVFAPPGRAVALKTADALRAQGVCIENYLPDDGIAAALAYAKRKHMGGVLYFSHADAITLYDLAARTEQTVSVEALLEGYLNG